MLGCTLMKLLECGMFGIDWRLEEHLIFICGGLRLPLDSLRQERRNRPGGILRVLFGRLAL